MVGHPRPLPERRFPQKEKAAPLPDRELGSHLVGLHLISARALSVYPTLVPKARCYFRAACSATSGGTASMLARFYKHLLASQATG